MDMTSEPCSIMPNRMRVPRFSSRYASVAVRNAWESNEESMPQYSSDWAQRRAHSVSMSLRSAMRKAGLINRAACI